MFILGNVFLLQESFFVLLQEITLLKMKQIWQDRIASDPKIMFGKPVIKGTRIPVELILEKLALGETSEYLLQAYPRITREDIAACLFFALHSVKNDLVFAAA